MRDAAPSNSLRNLARTVQTSPSAWLLTPVLVALSTVDTLLSSSLTMQGLAASAALATLVGVILSSALGGLQWLLGRRSLGLQFAVWGAVGGTVALWTMDQLAVFARLGSAFHRLAISALLASIALGAAVMLVGVGLQPRSRHPYGWVVAAPLWLRAGIAGTMSAGALLCSWLDRTALLVTYPVAGHILQAASLGSLLVALTPCVTVRRAAAAMKWLTATSRWSWVTLFVLTLSGLRLVDPATAAAIQERPHSAFALQAARWLVDLDRDGYSPFFAEGDCNDVQSSVHPGAREQPRNQIDDDCRLGDSMTTPSPLRPDAVTVPAQPAPVSFVLITVDTVSAERTSLHGYARPTTPHLARWAAERAVVFDNAFTSGSSTSLALAANFRGVYPRRLRWTRTARTSSWRYPAQEHGEPELAPGEKVFSWYRLPKLETRPALPWWLKRRGVRTFATTALHMALPGTGVVGEFDEVVTFLDKGSKTPDDPGATAQALKWLATAGTSPFFLWVHYLGPHTPTTRSPHVTWFGPSVGDGYDHEIATFDHVVEPLLAELARRQDAGEPIAVALTADHGEKLGRLRFHGHVIDESVARIPMLLSIPGVEPRRIRSPVSSLDLFPTILALTNTPAPAGLDGVDLLPLAKGLRRDDGGRIVMSEAWVVDGADRVVSNKLTLTDGRYRLTRDFITRTDRVLEVSTERATHSERNLLGRVDVDHLKLALEDYLQQTGVDPYPATGLVQPAPMALRRNQ